MSFENLGLSEALINAVHEKNYREPTPIQSRAIPAILKGADVMACAQTGTGKTAGFTLPLLQRLSKKTENPGDDPRALILAPTRELAIQIHESLLDYGTHLSLRSTLVYGGVKLGKQIQRLGRGVDIVVATPGRLLDLHHQRAVRLDKIEMLVLDEADRMLDMGFIHDIKKILALVPKRRQNLLFSATFSREIRNFAKGLMHSPVEIDIAPKQTASASVEHKLHPVDKARKSQLLSHLIHEHAWFQALVFCRTKHGANKLVKQLAQSEIEALAIHGNKSQAQRVKALTSFKEGKTQILVATDIAARGIDIAQLSQVVNYDLPNVPQDYVHRIGRTGRAGEKGQAISLVCADEIKQLCDIEKVLKRAIQREYIEGFEPNHELPSSVPKHPKTLNKKTDSKPGPRGQRNPKRHRNASKAKRPSGQNSWA